MELDVKRSVLLTLYCQNDWVKAIVKSDLLDRVAAVQDAARKAGLEVIHVRAAHPPGYPVVGPLANFHEKNIKARGTGVDGTLGGQFHAKVMPRPGEAVITTQHSGPFVGTALEQALRGRDARTIVVTGIATSGCVKNIVTDGTNRFFDVVVIVDCCEDMDPNAHLVLTEKVFPQVCRVARSGELLGTLTGRVRAS